MGLVGDGRTVTGPVVGLPTVCVLVQAVQKSPASTVLCDETGDCQHIFGVPTFSTHGVLRGRPVRSGSGGESGNKQFAAEAEAKSEAVFVGAERVDLILKC